MPLAGNIYLVANKKLNIHIKEQVYAKNFNKMG